MTIKDRGLTKWQGAFFMPEHVGLLGEMYKDYHREQKLELDESQIAEFESRVHYAMEFAYFVSLDVWCDGFVATVVGRVHRLDAINKELYIKSEEGGMERVRWSDVGNVKVLD